MPEFVQLRHALEPAPLTRLRKAVLASPYVGDSPLAGSFYASRGFAMTFKRPGLSRLRGRFPFLEPYLDLVLDPCAVRLLAPWPLRLLPPRLFPQPNAFYLNLLLIGPGAGVGLHIDGTLRQDSGVTDAVPRLVSVLYLQVPDPGQSRGGELHLLRSWREVGLLQPEPGTLVHFRGDLKHEVLPFQDPSSGALRASLVCEQYRFRPEALARLPELAVHSKNGFRAYLADRRGVLQA